MENLNLDTITSQIYFAIDITNNRPIDGTSEKYLATTRLKATRYQLHIKMEYCKLSFDIQMLVSLFNEEVCNSKSLSEELKKQKN